MAAAVSRPQCRERALQRGCQGDGRVREGWRVGGRDGREGESRECSAGWLRALLSSRARWRSLTEVRSGGRAKAGSRREGAGACRIGSPMISIAHRDVESLTFGACVVFTFLIGGLQWPSAR
jgi:hypothetical protein